MLHSEYFSFKLRFRISNDYHDHGTKFKTLDASGPADPSDSLLDRSRTNTDVQSEVSKNCELERIVYYASITSM